MSTIKTVNVIHPSGVTNNIVTDDSGNVAVGGALTVGGVAAVAVAPGTSGNVLTSDGTDWTSATAPVINSQTFDASGTWTKPSGYAAGSRVHIQAWGAGGSGGRNTTAAAMGGGGGGGYNEIWLTLSALGATETVTIGAGGASRSGSNQAGAQGGNSSLGSHITGWGGGPGSANFATGDPRSGGGGGGGQLSAASLSDPGGPSILAFVRTAVPSAQVSIGTGRKTILDEFAATFGPFNGQFHGGGGGASGSLPGATSVYGGGGGGGGATTGANGGTSPFGGNGGAAGSTGVAGSQPGGGGGGGTSTSGAGGDGRVIITVFPA